MRISDWSSDVCSSDLPAGQFGDAFHLVGDGAELFVEGDAFQLLRVEIGRASCRERVCQYVSISVVAVSLKNKIQSHSLMYTSSHFNLLYSLSIYNLHNL